MSYCDTINTTRLIEFTTRLFKKYKLKALIVLNNFTVHYSKIFKLWMVKKKNRTEAFYLPSCFSELNPDEILNSYLKTNFYSVYVYWTTDRFRKKSNVIQNNLMGMCYY